uniref:Glycoprotein n=1 Tax=Elaeophora elaphi TaxID=1147741 RepID=A0A0R3S564_9BILA
MTVAIGYCWLVLIVTLNSMIYCLEPRCVDVNCYTPLHSKIGSNYSVYGITQGGVIFVADMMKFSSSKFLNDLKAIDAKIKHFDCSTATVHFASTNRSILGSANAKKNATFFIIDAPKARIILPSCNWTIYNDILYCEIYWSATKFARIHHCYHPNKIECDALPSIFLSSVFVITLYPGPKNSRFWEAAHQSIFTANGSWYCLRSELRYYYARWSNQLYYLCYNDDGISNETLFVDEGLELGLVRFGYKDTAPGFASLSDVTTVDYLGQIIALNEMNDHYPSWLQPFQGENALKPGTERLLTCLVENKIRYLLQTTLTQFCIFEILTFSFRMTAQLLPKSFSEAALAELLKYNKSQLLLSVKRKRLPVNVLPVIITRQKSMIEQKQISGDIIGTLHMDTFINVTLAMLLYTCFFIIIFILFIRWRIALIPITLFNY